MLNRSVSVGQGGFNAVPQETQSKAQLSSGQPPGPAVLTWGRCGCQLRVCGVISSLAENLPTYTPEKSSQNHERFENI